MYFVNRMDPLWNSLVVGGVQDGKPFLGTITMLGVHYSDDHIATGVLSTRIRASKGLLADILTCM